MPNKLAVLQVDMNSDFFKMVLQKEKAEVCHDNLYISFSEVPKKWCTLAVILVFAVGDLEVWWDFWFYFSLNSDIVEKTSMPLLSIV